MLPTFMPVATKSQLKQPSKDLPLRSQQMEALGVTLILNNTYHLNLSSMPWITSPERGRRRAQVPKLGSKFIDGQFAVNITFIISYLIILFILQVVNKIVADFSLFH